MNLSHKVVTHVKVKMVCLLLTSSEIAQISHLTQISWLTL